MFYKRFSEFPRVIERDQWQEIGSYDICCKKIIMACLNRWVLSPDSTHALSVNWSVRHHYEQVQTAYSKRRI